MNCSALKIYRKHNNISQKDFAKLLNITPVWLSDIERGRRSPSARLCRLIQEVTHNEVTFNDLIAPIGQNIEPSSEKNSFKVKSK